MDYYLITSLFFCQPLLWNQQQNSAGFFPVWHKRKWLTNHLPRCIITKHLRECWNGRQARLRCVWLRRVGSSPISRTRKDRIPDGYPVFSGMWESPRKPNDGSQRTGRRFPAIGKSPSDAILNKSDWITFPRRGESRFVRRTRRSHGRFVNRPYDADYKTVRKIGICQSNSF